MKLKKTHIISLILFSGLLFTKPVLAEDTISSDNTPMGHYIEQIQTQETSKDSSSVTSSTTPNIRARSFAAAPTANVPSDLKSDDNTLPRKDAVDIASYQSWMTQADFNSLKTSGVKSIVVKLTEGTNYTNPYAANQIKMAQNAGLNVAVYHYARLTGANSQSAANSLAIQEAAYFVKIAKSFGLSSNIVMIMDCEQPYRDGSGNIIGPNPITVDWATAGVQFANTLKANGYSNTKFYTSASWIGTDTATCQMNYNTLGGPKNLWAAQYLYGKPSSSNLQNTQYGAWQYTSQMYYQGTSNLKANAVDTSIDYSNYFTSTSPVPPSTYTITFNTDGGTPIANQSVAAGSVVSQPAAPTKAGFNFSGWYSDSSLTQAYNFAKVITSNTTLYAKWIPITSPSISYQAQVQNIGWQKNSYNGETAGTTGLGLRMESLKISLINLSNGLTNSNSHIQYQGYVQNIGWQNPVQDGTIAGTVGQGLRFEAIKMNLSGEIANQYDLYYRVQAQNIGWMDWAKNGEAAGTSTMSYRLEAIQIQLVKKGNPAPGATTFTFLTTPSLQYCTQVQNIGWQNPVSTGQISGTMGKSLRTEALKINIGNLSAGIDGGVSYSSQIQNIGWQAPVSNGQISGTVGQSLRLEALKINLTGRISQYFDINYASQVQNIGWQAPVSNGQISGTVGMSLRVEAVKLSLSPK